MKIQVNNILSENKNRRKVLFSKYDPMSGYGSPLDRFKLNYTVNGNDICVWLPKTMRLIPIVAALVKHKSIEGVLHSMPGSSKYTAEFILELNKERLKHDFEFWAASHASIQDKETKDVIPFILNRPQRKLLKKLEELRVAGTPLKIILLKARQWGGSTLVQMYFAWIQLMHKKNWHCAIVADVDDQARNISNMFDRMAKHYPEETGSITFKPFKGSTKIREIVERGNMMGISSVQSPDATRSFDYAMLHLSEVGLWKSTPKRSAEDLAQAIRSTVPDVPYSSIVLESTAKGVGTFFHREWQRAEKGQSNYAPVFVAWWEIERYQRHIKDYKKFIAGMNQYDWFLWELGATLEGINWYNWIKINEGYDDWRMKSEFPSTADEAFQSTGRRAFAPIYVQRARKTCQDPFLVGDIYANERTGKKAFEGLEFQPGTTGDLKIWALPDKEVEVRDRYCAFADIGGRTEEADWSVLTILDRYWMMDGGVPEVVASFRTHMDQDLVAWKFAQICYFYNKALLAVETNSLKKESSEGDHFYTILDEIVEFYENLYTRTDPQKIREGMPIQWGFHTNQATKPMLIDGLNAALREGTYIERDLMACDEMDYFEIKDNGAYGAVDGEHDDLVISRAGAKWLAYKMDLPKIIDRQYTRRKNKKIVNESTI